MLEADRPALAEARSEERCERCHKKFLEHLYIQRLIYPCPIPYRWGL
jgi:hypothetical protein